MSLKKILLIFILIILLIYITNLTSIPTNIVLFEGENLNLGTTFGVFQNKEKVISTSFNTEESNVISEETIHLSLLNLINVKDVNVTTIENTKVIPLRKYHWVKALFKWGFSNWNDRNRREKAV